MKLFIKILKYTVTAFIAIILFIAFYLLIVTRVSPPDVEDITLEKVVKVDDVRMLGNNWLQKNEFGLWEMYVEGEAYERGRVSGELAKDLVRYQEEVFVDQITRVIPSRIYLHFLRVMIGYFNRNLDKHIPEEYLKEIYGISKSASDEFNFIGRPYTRMLNYHAAHDIGHALLDYELVEDIDLQLGCTSFSAWGSKTADGKMLSGRNFDFNFGDEFAENVIVKFIKPEKGIPFGFITWGGMIGVVSGMNMEGLSVTINAGKSHLPTSSSTPVTIVARDILQYASNIEEAYAIAEKHQVFVSESFLITSANDNMSVIIEKSPKETGLVATDTTYILCTNHFQSETFADDEINLTHIEETATGYRFRRLKELVDQAGELTKYDVAAILRDYKGLSGECIGIGNEKSINQFIAHHAIIFKPDDRKFLVSTRPYTVGPFIEYDMNKVFDGERVNISRKRIPKDTFLLTDDYIDFQEYERLFDKINVSINENKTICDDTLAYFISTNENFFKTYKLVGNYYKSQGDCKSAIKYYEIGLNKEIDNFAFKRAIKRHIEECEN